jgi:hypothetical protein
MALYRIAIIEVKNGGTGFPAFAGARLEPRGYRINYLFERNLVLII